MHSTTIRALAISFIAALATLSCGTGTVPAEDTTSAKKAKPSNSDSDSDSDKAAADDKQDDAAPAKDDEKAKGSGKKKKSNDSGLTLVRKPKDYLTAPDVVFMYSFKESDAKDKAEKECSDKTKGDQEKQASCMVAAQKKFGADGYHFEQDDQGKWWWETVKFKGSAITYLHRIPIEFGKETEKTISVKPIGKDEGKGPKGYVPAEVVFEVPNAYQIIQSDPDDGKIVFEAKIGLLGDPGTKRKR